MENQQNYAEMDVSAEISTNFQGKFTRLKNKKVRADSILVQFVRIPNGYPLDPAAAALDNSQPHPRWRGIDAEDGTRARSELDYLHDIDSNTLQTQFASRLNSVNSLLLL